MNYVPNVYLGSNIILIVLNLTLSEERQVSLADRPGHSRNVLGSFMFRFFLSVSAG